MLTSYRHKINTVLFILDLWYLRNHVIHVPYVYMNICINFNIIHIVDVVYSLYIIYIILGVYNTLIIVKIFDFMSSCVSIYATIYICIYTIHTLYICINKYIYISWCTLYSNGRLFNSILTSKAEFRQY